MTAPWHLAIVGFTPFERTTLQSCIQLAAEPRSCYSLVEDVELADVLIADTDKAGLRDTLMSAQLLDKTLAIGTKGVDGCMAQLPRPINPLLLLRTLDGLLALRTRRPQPPAADLARDQPRTAATAAAAHEDPMPSRFPGALVVDPSKDGLRFMANHLVRFGFAVRLTRSGEEALKAVAERPFEFVFLELALTGISGFETCRMIKQRPYADGQRAPRVVAMTARDGRIDRIRAGLAGCDAFLSKPLQHDALMAVIGEHVVANATMADTAYAPMTQM